MEYEPITVETMRTHIKTLKTLRLENPDVRDVDAEGDDDDEFEYIEDKENKPLTRRLTVSSMQSLRCELSHF